MSGTTRPARAASALLLTLALVAGTASRAQSQTASPIRPITLNAVADDRLTVMVLSGGMQSIPSIVPNAINAFPAPVVIRVEWDLPGLQWLGLGAMSLVAYFNSPSQALVNGANAIPSSRVEARMTTGAPTTFMPINAAPVQGVGTVGGSRTLWTRSCGFFGIQCISGSRTDQLNLRLNLVGHPTVAGTYTGVLNLRAVVY